MFGKSFFSKLFAQQDVEQLNFEQKLKEMTVTDVVREFDINKKNKMEIKTNMSEQELVQNEEIVVEDAPQVSEETEVQVEEPVAEVVEEQPVVEEAIEEPKPVEEGIEPPTEQAVETLNEEEVVEEQPEQEEPQEPIEEKPETPEVEEVSEEVAEEPKEEVVEEEQPVEIEQPAEPVVVEVQELPKDVEVPTAINVVKEQVVEVSEVKTQDLLKEIENLKAEKAENEIKIAKMELSKSVEVDFAGVPGNVEDKTNMIYEIQNSALSSEAKDFIFNSLKSLSVQNLSDCEEVGHDNEVEEDVKEKENKAIKEAMAQHGLTENQAFLYVRGDRTLNEAKRISNKVKSKK